MLVRSCTCTRSSLCNDHGQLSVADVHRHDLARPGPQEHVGEAAGGRTGVEAALAADGEAVLGKRLQRPGELVARPGRRSRRRGVVLTTIATSVVTPVAGFVARAPRPSPGRRRQLAGVLARTGQPRRTSSWSSRRRRGGTAFSRPGGRRTRRAGVEGATQLLVGALEHRT
jgi:hypothetical protein